MAAGIVEALDPRRLMVDEKLHHGTVDIKMDLEVFIFSELR